MGWFGERLRHSNARRLRYAGPLYKTKQYAEKMGSGISKGFTTAKMKTQKFIEEEKEIRRLSEPNVRAIANIRDEIRGHNTSIKGLKSQIKIEKSKMKERMYDTSKPFKSRMELLKSNIKEHKTEIKRLKGNVHDERQKMKDVRRRVKSKGRGFE